MEQAVTANILLYTAGAICKTFFLSPHNMYSTSCLDMDQVSQVLINLTLGRVSKIDFYRTMVKL